MQDNPWSGRRKVADCGLKNDDQSAFHALEETLRKPRLSLRTSPTTKNKLLDKAAEFLTPEKAKLQTSGRSKQCH